MKPLILASSSKNRIKLLKTLNIPFKVKPANIDEQSIIEQNPVIRVKKLAFMKADKIAKKETGLIIGCDTFTVLNKEILEKPKNKKEAELMLKKISGNKIVSYTGLCVINKIKKEKIIKISKTIAYFRKIDEEEIREYVHKFPVTKSAAGYNVDFLYTISFIDKVVGPLGGFIYGLPLEHLVPILKEEGYQPHP